ncbi:inactive phospholipase C-like protein 2 isoform X2 [Panonychus citri]|uniref:inactive phospholipase C-like protein 2 isoform X2 n=1 Tax=Panonychus citri TaxID=50023 RepID=UPI0023071E37|nr:inactive phospholipase C-like protein 2 isoform X2 [Panonychus citri]
MMMETFYNNVHNQIQSMTTSGQKMRQKWLEEAFNQADIESRGVLDEPQTISLMKRLNNHLCSGRLKQKLLEYNLGKDGDEKGFFNKHNFVNLFYETATRPDIYFILVRYCGKDYMTLEDLQLFLEGEQGVCGITLEECAQLIDRYEPCEESKRNQQLLIDGFTQLLVSPESDLINPAHNFIWQDMNQSLSHYFIATSHNTYLLEDQLKGPSSTEGYRKTLLQGSRCVKIDTWDSPTGPVVFHGNTLTTKVPLQDVLETINEYAFVQSPYPVIIHLENHCSLERQKEIANQLTTILGDKLFIPGKTRIDHHVIHSNNNNTINLSSTVNGDQSLSSSSSTSVSPTPGKQSTCNDNMINNNSSESQLIKNYTNLLLSPELLKYKIIIKGKKLSSPEDEFGEVSDEDESIEPRFSTTINPSANTNTTTSSTSSSSISSNLSNSVNNKTFLCKQLSDLVYLRRFRCNDFGHVLKNQKNDQVCYLDEAFASKLALASPEDFAHHNKNYCTQVAPDRGRIDSSNINPLDFWNCGSQMVAMNYQSSGQMMDLYRGWFNQNGGCGYVLKPAFLRERFCLFNARRKDSLPGIDPLCLRVKIISGQQLPRPKGASFKAVAIDPYVTVQVLGVPADNAEMRTRTISNEANNPIFDESFEFTISVPELALLRLVVLDDDYINDDFIGQATIPIECVQTGYRHVRLSAYNGELIPEAVLFVHLSMTHRYGSKQKLRRKRSWGSKQSNDLRSIGIKQADEAFKNVSNLLYQSIQLRKDVEKSMIDLCDECNLNENANVAQCLRILTLRLASCSSVNSFHIDTSNEGAPAIKIGGEMTVKLQKSISALDKALAEFVSIPQSSSLLLEMLGESHDVIVRLGLELNQLSISAGIKGRKADKAVENFMWNLSLIKTEIDILRAVKDDSECALKQVTRLSKALERLFSRERESTNKTNANHLLASSVAQSSASALASVAALSSSSSSSTSATPSSVLAPGNISTCSLTPSGITGGSNLSGSIISGGVSPTTSSIEIKPPIGPPVTPTSPGDARLRSILKKPASSPTTPIPPNLDSLDERISYFHPMGDKSPPPVTITTAEESNC